MSHITRKPVFGGFGPGKTLLQRVASLESLNLARIGTIHVLSRKSKKIGNGQELIQSDYVDLPICCSHMAKTGFLMTWLKYNNVGRGADLQT